MRRNKPPRELPRRLDMLLAFKAIGLSEQLSSNEKRVAIAVMDSFNRKTGQCDPSLNRIAYLLGLSRSTVIRSVLKLERLGYIIKTRHAAIIIVTLTSLIGRGFANSNSVGSNGCGRRISTHLLWN